MPMNVHRLVRWGYALVSLLYLWSIHPFLGLFYGPASVCPEVPTSTSFATVIWWLALVNSLALLTGKWTRLWAVIQFLWIGFFSLSHCRAFNYGDQIFASTAFLMMFLPAEDQADNPWLRRTFMLFLVTLYGVPLIVRIQGHHWWDGTASWIALADPSVSRIWKLLVDKDPQRIPACLFYAVTYASLAYEGLFPVLIWFKRLRTPLVIAGLIFHAVMGVLLNLGLFPLQMAILLLGCLEPSPLKAIETKEPASNPA